MVKSKSSWSDLFVVLPSEERIDNTCESGADDRCQPEEPELLDGPATNEDGGAGAAGRVDREVGDGDADQVDEGQSKACLLYTSDAADD